MNKTMVDLPIGTATTHHYREKERCHRNKMLVDLPAGTATTYHNREKEVRHKKKLMADLPAGTAIPHHSREKELRQRNKLIRWQTYLREQPHHTNRDKELSCKNKVKADLPAGAATSMSRKTMGFMLLMIMVMMQRCDQDAETPEPGTFYTVDIKEIKNTWLKHSQFV